MTNQKPYRVLLYYKYVPIEDHELFAEEHLEFCKNLGVKGRILVAREGINGTLSGTIDQTDTYMETLRRDPRFSDIEFKIDEADSHAFKKIFVRARDEIVSLRLEQDVSPNNLTGEYLEPEAFYQELQQDDTIVLDARNEYEYRVGHFRNAIKPDIESFRELPEWIEKNLADQKDKRVLTYCTGGIRCEKLTGYLRKEGFKDVAQLHGGIVNYGKDPEVQGKLYDGKCYVFDERRMVHVNRTDEDVVIGKCYHCGKTEDRYVNCANPECNLQYICCEECEENYKRSCSDECREHPRNRYVVES
ncbi:MAG TPA: rhodanese-related sulfurtransferase [Bacillales bacterium]|nr:rhodanese-related sulfurtransferase [Bacillales bacterium]